MTFWAPALAGITGSSDTSSPTFALIGFQSFLVAGSELSTTEQALTVPTDCTFLVVGAIVEPASDFTTYTVGPVWVGSSASPLTPGANVPTDTTAASAASAWIGSLASPAVGAQTLHYQHSKQWGTDSLGLAVWYFKGQHTTTPVGASDANRDATDNTTASQALALASTVTGSIVCAICGVASPGTGFVITDPAGFTADVATQQQASVAFRSASIVAPGGTVEAGGWAFADASPPATHVGYAQAAMEVKAA